MEGTSVLIYKESSDKCTFQEQEEHQEATQSQPETLRRKEQGFSG